MCFTAPPSRHDPEITVPARPVSLSHHTSRIAVITPPSHPHPHSAPKRSQSQSRAHPALTETRRLSSGQLVTVRTISPRASGTQAVKREREWQRSPRQSGAVHGSPRHSGNVRYHGGGSPRQSGGLGGARLSNRAITQEIVPASARQSRTVVIAPPRQSGNSVHFQEEVEVLGGGRPVIVGSGGSRRYSNSGGGGPHYRSPRQSNVSVRGTREKMVEVDENGREGRGWERRDERRW
ncbi:hypothetical protein N7G274_001542 [Stereocaulon virgatum]|uniref:Uncharacterized protein n=1 Tax=Stereocaulon virgatum TaxID=373712 RepID=A0ABR4ALK7_9LECA